MSVIDAKHRVCSRVEGSRATDGGMFDTAAVGVTNDPQAQLVLHRIGNAICPFSTVDRVEYAKAVAAVAVAAKRSPRNAYAKATL